MWWSVCLTVRAVLFPNPNPNLLPEPEPRNTVLLFNILANFQWLLLNVFYSFTLLHGYLAVSVCRTALPDSDLSQVVEARSVCWVERMGVLLRALVAVQLGTGPGLICCLWRWRRNAANHYRPPVWIITYEIWLVTVCWCVQIPTPRIVKTTQQGSVLEKYFGRCSHQTEASSG